MAGNSLQITDAGVIEALKRALRHAPPFTVAECERFDGELAVSDARDLSLLEQLSSVKRLQIFGSDLKTLTAVASMRDLESLRIIACPVTKLDPIRRLPRLEELEVSFTFVEDAAPIFTLPALHRVRLLGNPLVRASYEQVRGGPKGPASGQRPPAVQITRPNEWEAGCKLHKRGIALCVSAVDWRVPLLVKPGVGWAASRRLTLGEIDSLLEDTDVTTESILTLPWPPETAAPASDIVSARVIGDGAEALGWIDRSDLPASEAGALRSFVSGFAGLTYYRDGEPNLAYKEQVGKVSLPEWYRKTRMTLGFALPGEWVKSFLAERGSTEYRIELIGYDSDQSGPKIKEAGFYPVAIASDRSETFAIKLDGRDRRVYALHEEWYLYEGAEPKSNPYVEFPSYAAMLAEIVAIRREDGTLIQRADVKPALPVGGKASAAKRSIRARGAARADRKKPRRKS